MKTMKTIPFLLKLLAFVLLFQVGSVNAAASPQLRIESAVVEEDQTISIVGQFDDNVFVTLYDIPLTCLTEDPTLLKCEVPADLSPGTYRLEVFIENTSNGNSVVTTDGTIKPTQFYGTLDVTLGVTGPQGIEGLKGETGDTGLQGLKGETGDTGLQGLKGETGDTGLQGLKGETGDTGLQGLVGNTGLQGLPGEPRSGCVLVPHGTYYGDTGVVRSLFVDIEIPVFGIDVNVLVNLGNARIKGIYCDPVIPGGSCSQTDLLDFKYDCPVGHTWVQASAFSRAEGEVHVTFTNLGRSDVGCWYHLTWYGVECQ